MPWSFRQLLAPLSALLLFMSACGDDPEVRPVCGNGIVEAGELCDDGNRINGDGCENTCRPTPDAGTGEPDSGTPDDDAGTGEDDAGTIEDDAGTGEDDAGTGEDDAGTGEDDAGTIEDGGTGEPDSGTGEPDSGTGEPDSGTGEPDSGTGEPDSGTGEPDSGTGEPDSGTGEPDSGTGEPDSGTGEPDSGTGEPDSGTGEPDSGTGEPDSGTGEPDSGTGEPDSGTGEPDSGTDAGTVQVSLESFGPTGVFARTGTTGPTFPEALTIRLREDAPAEVWVEVASSSPAVTVQGSMVRFAPGERTATVQVTANIAADPETDKATLTATLGNDSREATVRVLAANQAAELSTLSPELVSVGAGQTQGFTVELDVPPAQDTVIQLALEPAALGTVPATVTVAANTLSAKFDFTAGGASFQGFLVATHDGASISSAIEVTATTTNHVVISEIAPAGPGGADDEFIELYNPTSSPVDLSGYRIQYKSATGANYTGNYALPAGSIIAPRGYFLVARGSYVGTVTRDASWGTVFAMAAGSGHVRLGYPELALNDPLGHPLVIDTVGYGATANAPEGNRVAATVPTAGSYERKASATSTVESMTAGGADELRGNAYDSDDNAADFIVRPTRQPQNRASPAEP